MNKQFTHRQIRPTRDKERNKLQDDRHTYLGTSLKCFGGKFGRKIQSQEMKIVNFLNKSCKCLTSAHIRKLQKISANRCEKVTC